MDSRTILRRRRWLMPSWESQLRRLAIRYQVDGNRSGQLCFRWPIRRLINQLPAIRSNSRSSPRFPNDQFLTRSGRRRMAEIPIDQAADQIAAGTVAPMAEQHMLDTDGNPQIVDPGSVRLALQKGYKLVPQAVAEHVR